MAAALHFFKDDVPAGPHSFRRQIQFAVAARRAPRHASVGENTPPSPCRQVVVVRTPRVRRKKVAARRLLKVVLITLSRRQGNGIEARRAAPPQLAAPERRAAAATAHFWNPACKWCKQMATAGIFARLAAMRWQASQAGGVSPMSGCAAAVAPGADEAAPAAGRLGCASGSASGSGSGTTAATASGQGGIGARLPLGRQPSRTPASMSTTASRSPDAAGAVATPELATHCTNDSCHHRYDDHVRSAGSGAGAGSALAVAMDRVPAPGMAAPPMPAMRIRVPVQHDCAPGGALSPAGTPGARRRRLLRGGGGDDSSAAPPLPLSLSQATAGVGGRAVRMTGGPFSPTVASPGAASPHVAAVALSDGEEVGTPSRRALRRVPGATTTAAPVPPPSTTTPAHSSLHIPARPGGTTAPFDSLTSPPAGVRTRPLLMSGPSAITSAARAETAVAAATGTMRVGQVRNYGADDDDDDEYNEPGLRLASRTTVPAAGSAAGTTHLPPGGGGRPLSATAPSESGGGGIGPSPPRSAGGSRPPSATRLAPLSHTPSTPVTTPSPAVRQVTPSSGRRLPSLDTNTSSGTTDATRRSGSAGGILSSPVGAMPLRAEVSSITFRDGSGASVTIPELPSAGSRGAVATTAALTAAAAGPTIGASPQHRSTLPPSGAHRTTLSRPT